LRVKKQQGKNQLIIKINALALLFIVQFLLIFIALTIVFYRRFRKVQVKAAVSEVGVRRLRHEAKKLEEKSDEESGWKTRFSDMQSKFEVIKQHNEKLKKSIESLIPKAERTKEYESVIGEIEGSYAELDLFLRDMKKEKLHLTEQTESFQGEIKKLSGKLEESISKSEFDILQATKHEIDLKVNKLQKDLEEKNDEYEKLEKNYMWLETEYNALYENVSNGATKAT
jgi:chromosome segregation ATPase